MRRTGVSDRIAGIDDPDVLVFQQAGGFL